jgi:hypothetical protein
VVVFVVGELSEGGDDVAVVIGGADGSEGVNRVVGEEGDGEEKGGAGGC